MATQSSSIFTMTLLAGLVGLISVGCTTSATSSVPQSPMTQSTTPAQPNETASAKQNSSETVSAKQDSQETKSTQISESNDDKAVIASDRTSSNAAPKSSVPSSASSKEIPVDYQGEIISSVKTDWDGDGLRDTALLVPSKTEDDRATLLVYFAKTSGKPQLEFEFNNLVWKGAMYGTQPALSVNDQGSLVIESGNDAIGRGRWNQKITAIYENNLFMVAGFTYTYRDTLDLSAGGTCDVNFLTGRGVRSDKDFRVSKQLQSLLDWTEESAPKECQF